MGIQKGGSRAGLWGPSDSFSYEMFLDTIVCYVNCYNLGPFSVDLPLVSKHVLKLQHQQKITCTNSTVICANAFANVSFIDWIYKNINPVRIGGVR